jgi:molybdate transport system substrate-binding protein
VSAVLALVLAMNLAVLCAGAASETVHQLAERYAQATGNTVSIVTGTAGQLRARLNAGERADVVILPAPGIADLERGGGLVAGTRTGLGRTGMGLGVRRGAPVPELSSPEALKRVLLSARAIVATDPASGATAGIYFAKVLARLGIAEAVKPKLAVVPGGSACAAVAKGDADVCVQNISEILPVGGVTLAGPFPAALQNFITYTAAVPANAPAPEAGRALIGYLTAPAQGIVWRSAGFENAQP